jgi:drug/metabolite transporter (DMT)-like permease
VKVIVAVFGTLLILMGVPMLVLPGPGILFILAGLALLALKFPWAKRLSDRVKERFQRPKKPSGGQTGSPDDAVGR